MTTINGTSKIITPLGERYHINADFTASGVEHPDIKNFMDQTVLPYYSNVHSNAHNGQLMHHYMEQSRDIIRKSLRCKPCDKIIMTGQGCTGAIMHLIHLLNIRHETKPITHVYLTVAEHHSNYLPWKHLPVNVKLVPLKESGIIDVDFLMNDITKTRKEGHPVICSFIAGSNVTGVIQPFHGITRTLRKKIPGCLVFWDFAGCAPYVEINMHLDNWSYFDAIMISPHKMLGGPGTPGLLVANANLFRNKEPYSPGGGTVRFVCSKFTHYSSNLETRESGGTPNILGCIRAGLCFQLKDRIIVKIKKREHDINLRVRTFLDNQKDIVMLNPETRWNTSQFPVYALVIPNMHYNLVTALLNDFFGIQSRGGVSCCSIYAQHLFHIKSKQQEKIYKDIIEDKGVSAGYGWCRVSFHYSMTDELVEYILKSLSAVAKYGQPWKSKYQYDTKSNHWNYKGHNELYPTLDYRKNIELTARVITPELLGKQFNTAIKELKN